MPKLWNATIEAHRREVRDAIVHAAAKLVHEHGLRSVTMSQIAEATGIGRATLYKYFPDVNAILLAWHEQQVAGHFEQLLAARDGTENAGNRLEAVLQAYAHGAFQHQGTELAAAIHHGEQYQRARQRLGDVIRDLVKEGQTAGRLRTDASPAELASYCINALAAAGDLTSGEAFQRLVSIVMAGMRA